MSSQRISCRIANGRRDILPDKIDTERLRVEARVNGIAKTSARHIPAVAIAIVRQASFTTNRRKSPSTEGGKKSPRNLALTRRFSDSKKIQGLNSVATKAGISTTIAAKVQKTR
jgi:hypothetical protein